MNAKRYCTRIWAPTLLCLAGAALFALPARSQTGEALYKAKCAACHGADGKGQTATGKAMKAGDFAAPEVQKTSDADLGAIISNGKDKMPAYGKSLKADQIQSLVAFIRSFKN